MTLQLSTAFISNFLGQSPRWYKQLIIAFLVVNPVIFLISPFLAGWLLIVEFIFTLAMALKCYPLQLGGLLAWLRQLRCTRRLLPISRLSCY